MSAGFELVWSNDFDADACRVHERNIGKIDPRDIREVPSSDIPDCDVVLAGFPCQPFSSAGLRKGVADARGLLYRECLRVVGDKRPKALLFENVKGLASSRDASGRKLVDVIVDDLAEMGYVATYSVLNASHYGVPQKRERLLIVGVRGDLGKAFEFPEGCDCDELTLRHVVVDVPAGVPDQVDWPLSPQALSMVRRIPQGGSWKSVPYEELAPRFRKIRDNMRKYHSPNFYRRFSLDEVNGTITASAQPENCGIVHPLHDRRYTVREVARIQSFPDDFLFFTGSMRDIVAMYKVIGNAVPPKLAESVARSMMEQVFCD